MVLLQDVINIEVEQDTNREGEKKKKKSRERKGAVERRGGGGGNCLRKITAIVDYTGTTRRWRKSSDEMASEKDKKTSD